LFGKLFAHLGQFARQNIQRVRLARSPKEPIRGEFGDLFLAFHGWFARHGGEVHPDQLWAYPHLC
jgi:hypothetical protein